MSTSAIIMMIISMTLLWGGMIAAMINVHRQPDMQRDSAEQPPQQD
ncbi:methionine/alanine import family NSS transporter small subunit [Streptomyces bohaiensis]|uniref:Methionine/alanine import family NSS transporter small subunit n=1 Tax=Streptomyces bohaiensis TaxID=1431344 RepID=A0ABX1C933_9ACTN|nr:methionine/alanine import family NSS transporter small subunit [Streptomyces bohaiensis]NJQ13857.1 methionine/alanine import family NSS transporter small subunit [Streptomyces bohaiensis]